MHRLRLSAVVITLALLAGCATHARRDNLTDTLNAYANTLRWGDFSHALGFIDPDYRDAHPLDPLRQARYKQVRVAGYDAGKGPVPVSDTEVRQIVKIGVINRHTQHERFIVDHQTWRWDADAGRWWLRSGLPDITQERR